MKMQLGLLLLALAAAVACEGKEGPTGPEGAQGPPGPPGLQGTPGPSGMTGLEIVSLTFPNIPAAPSSSAVPCPPGKRVLAGGYGLAFTGTEVGQSYPGIVSGNEGWIVSTYSSSGFTNDITVFAICAAATSTGASAKLAAPRQR